MSSYAEHLQPFFPYIPSSLISARCLDEILSVTQQLPPVLGMGPFMFECSLDDRPVADFSVAVMASRGDRAALSRLASTNIATTTLDPPGWARIDRFTRSWADASSPLGRAVEEVWLEFDVCLTRNAPGTTPSVFFRIDYQSPQEPSLRRVASGECLRAAKEGLGVLEVGHTSPSTLSRLAECFYALPAPARILFLGAMTSRATENVRVVASGMSRGGMLRYLQCLGFQRPLKHLELVADILDRTDRLWLALDIEDGEVSPRVGFDCYFDGAVRAGSNGGKWPEALDGFVEKGICTDAKRNALLLAAELANRDFDERVWPVGLRRVSKILGPDGFNKLKLDIHHIKVIDRPGVPLEAKAYLCGRYT